MHELTKFEVTGPREEENPRNNERSERQMDN